MQTPELDLTSLAAYRESCLRIAQERLSDYKYIDAIGMAEADLNAYPRLDKLAEPRDVKVLDVDEISKVDLDRAEEAVLDGRVFWEHTAAGEATRLKLGTKYMIQPARDLMPLDMIAARLAEEKGEDVTAADVARDLHASPNDLLPLSLGTRHMLQLSFDIRNLALKAGRDPAEVLAAQQMLTILNEKTAEDIFTQFNELNYFGFKRANCLFMVQPAFPGIDVKDGLFYFDEESPRRLHNHGQLVMQETMDRQIFRMDENGGRQYLSAAEFGGILDRMLDKISYNIEDLGYLTGSIDWPSLALALHLGAQNYNMVMEIVGNNPDKPIKGGMAAFDEGLARDVMIESFQLKGVSNEDIKYLNKNFNHYTNPKVAWAELKEHGLPMPIVVKNGFLYYQPVQGDINFLVRTAFVMRKVLQPIRAWKSAANTVDALNAMHAQDRQSGFRDYAEETLKL